MLEERLQIELEETNSNDARYTVQKDGVVVRPPAIFIGIFSYLSAIFRRESRVISFPYSLAMLASFLFSLQSCCHCLIDFS